MASAWDVCTDVNARGAAWTGSALQADCGIRIPCSTGAWTLTLGQQSVAHASCARPDTRPTERNLCQWTLTLSWQERITHASWPVSADQTLGQQSVTYASGPWHSADGAYNPCQLTCISRPDTGPTEHNLCQQCNRPETQPTQCNLCQLTCVSSASDLTFSQHSVTYALLKTKVVWEH